MNLPVFIVALAVVLVLVARKRAILLPGLVVVNAVFAVVIGVVVVVVVVEVRFNPPRIRKQKSVLIHLLF